MGSYKRAKFTHNHSTEVLQEVEVLLKEQAAKLKVEVKMSDLSEYEPSESDSE